MSSAGDASVYRFDPMADSLVELAAALGGEVVSLQHTDETRFFDPLKSAPSPRVIGLPAPTADEVRAARARVSFWSAGRCTAVRDLFAGTPEAGTVIQHCEKEHHMEVHAHRMTRADGSTTTWRH